MIKKNTIFLDGRKIGTYKAVLTAGSGHISFEGFESCESKFTDDQQIVLEWLKKRYIGDADPFGVTASLFSQTPRSKVIVASLELTKVEQAQVLQAYANWALEQEEK